MIRIATVFWVFVIAVAAFMLYRVKYEVQSLHTQIAQTTQKLEEERDAMRVVSAEWAYLNRPERLRALAAKHLGLTPATAAQIAVVEALPFPEKPEPEQVAQALVAPALKPVSYQPNPDAP